MKRLVSLICACLLLWCSFGVSASVVTLIDQAELLSSVEIEWLQEGLDDAKEQTGWDIIVITLDSLQGVPIEQAAEELYEADFYAEDGVLLLISMEYRDFYVYTRGAAVEGLSYDEIGYLSDDFAPFLSEGDYYDAFCAFADGVVMWGTYTPGYDISSDYDYDESYDVDYDEDYDYNYFSTVEFFSLPTLGIAFGIGVVVALIVVLVMKGKLKSVRPQNNASLYTRAGSMYLNEQSDRFLYHTVTRTRRETDNNSSGGGHSRGGGSSHSGGRGGKF